VSHIVAHPSTTVCILDTTGTFDVVRMHQTILSRLNASSISADVNSEAEALLDRIKIARIFDFLGLFEAINEIKNETFAVVQPQGGKDVKRTVIPDSEDESSDAEFEQNPTSQNIGCVVIDNLTTVMNPLFKTNHVQGKLCRGAC
jgi:hypothetical protein